MSQATVNVVDFMDTQIFGERGIAGLMTTTAIPFTVPEAGNQTMYGRPTMVMRNTGSRRVIGQFHFSMPYRAQDSGQSFPGA